LEDLRVNIIDLIRVTASTQKNEIPIVFATIKDTDKEGERGSLQLGETRSYALVALSEFSRKHSRKETDSCSAIWVDGRGRIVEVMCGGVSFDPSAHIGKYSPYERYRVDIQNDYHAMTSGNDYNFVSAWGAPYQPEAGFHFDGSMGCYLGYLQHVELTVESSLWAKLLW
jgi:hypothetical protein